MASASRASLRKWWSGHAGTDQPAKLRHRPEASVAAAPNVGYLFSMLGDCAPGVVEAKQLSRAAPVSRAR